MSREGSVAGCPGARIGQEGLAGRLTWEGIMTEWIGIAAFMAAWVVLQTWVLPKLGVAT